MADEGGLPAAVLADDRDPIAGRDRQVDAVQCARPLGIGEPDALERHRRHARHRRGPIPRAGDGRERPAGRARAARRPTRRAAVGEHRRRGVVHDDPAGVDRHDPAAHAVEQVRLVLRDQERRPGAASARSASPTSRVPSGSSCAVGSSRTSSRGRIARSEAITTSWACPPDSRWGSRSARASMPRIASAARAPLDRLGPAARGSSGRGPPPRTPCRSTPDSCVAGFWKPIADPRRELVERLARPSASPSIDRLPPVSAPPIEPGASPDATRHERRLAGLVGPDQADDLAVRELEVDVVEDRLWRSRRSGSSTPAARASVGQLTRRPVSRR